MRVKFYGTRGSVPVAGVPFNKYGGNTTCLRVESDCIPESTYLVVDAGSGIVRLDEEVLANGITEVNLLFTHYHYDHTQGLPLCVMTYLDAVRINCWGPEENGVGPEKMLRDLMYPPYHPKSYSEVAHKFRNKGFQHPAGMVMVVHPEGGFKAFDVKELASVEQAGSQVKFRNGSYDLSECLVIRMWTTNHPQRAVSYRFEERKTGNVFVFLTDHENTDSPSQALLRHLKGVDILAIDAQYQREVYDTKTAGFGHGTADYGVRIANASGARELVLTHHDPRSCDQVVDDILLEAKAEADRVGFRGLIRSVADYDVIEIS